MTRFAIPMLCAILAGVIAGAADPPKLAKGEKAEKKDDRAAKVRKQFYRCWLEVEKTEAGVRTTDPNKLNGLEFGLDGWASWGRNKSEELS